MEQGEEWGKLAILNSIEKWKEKKINKRRGKKMENLENVRGKEGGTSKERL